MVLGIVRDSALGGKKDTCKFCTQFLLGIVLVTESVRFVESGPVQPRGMATPVRKFVERRAVVSTGFLEGVLRRQVDTVLCPTVKRPIRLIVRDLRAGVRKNLLASLDRFKSRTRCRLERWDVIDLLCVENRVDPMNES